MGQDAAAAAAQSLRLLSSDDLRHIPAQGPQPRRATPSSPGAPVNLGLLDYLTSQKREVIDHTRAVTGDLIPAPAEPGDIYDWYIHHTGDADADEKDHRDYVIARHTLEHAIRLGDTGIVCKEPCPTCGRWGLMWTGQAATCSHKDCRTPDGRHSSFTPDRLAAQKVRRTEIWRRNAT